MRSFIPDIGLFPEPVQCCKVHITSHYRTLRDRIIYFPNDKNRLKLDLSRVTKVMGASQALIGD